MRFPTYNCSFIFLLLSSFILFNACSTDDEVQSAITVTTADLIVTIVEMPSEGQVLGTIDGSTSEGSVTFSILEQSVAGAFEIDATTGELKVLNPDLFDYEQNPILTGTVKVANGNVFEKALVVIYLEDIDETNIFEGRVWLKTQEELNAFGANNYTHITGQLVIGTRYDLTFSDITDLTPLSSLVSIGENFLIAGNENLANLNGLHNLEFIGSHLEIFDNPSLTSVAEMNKLHTVTMNVNIFYNPALQNLDGLTLKHIGGTLTIEYNLLLENIEGLQNLVSVGSIDIYGNSNLASLKGFENITTLSTLSIVNNDALPNLDGLQNLTQINKVLSIGYCNLFTSLNELQNVSSSLAEIYITNNSALLNIRALSNFQSAERITISQNPSLSNLQGLENIHWATEIYISENSSITNLEGMNNLTTVDYLGIYENPNLSSIAGLENLREITFSLYLTNNPDLTNLDSLDNLNIIGDDLSISENISLTNFCGLQTVIQNNGPGGDYRVYGNAYNPTRQDILNGNCSL